jgi:hypothetical protein
MLRPLEAHLIDYQDRHLVDVIRCRTPQAHDRKLMISSSIGQSCNDNCVMGRSFPLPSAICKELDKRTSEAYPVPTISYPNGSAASMSHSQAHTAKVRRTYNL